MTRTEIKRTAENISNQEIYNMLKRAKESITDWTVISKCNKGMTKGVAWNILTKAFDIDADLHILHKMNLIREFGDFLSPEHKPARKSKVASVNPTHQNPQLDYLKDLTSS